MMQFDIFLSKTGPEPLRKHLSPSQNYLFSEFGKCFLLEKSSRELLCAIFCKIMLKCMQQIEKMQQNYDESKFFLPHFERIALIAKLSYLQFSLKS